MRRTTTCSIGLLTQGTSPNCQARQKEKAEEVMSANTHTTNPARPVIAIALALAATVFSACSATQSSEAACNVSVTRASRQPTVYLLTDGASPALDAATSTLVSDPERVFSSSRLGFTSAPNGKQAGVGSVVLATYDGRGRIVTHGTFNLAGEGNDPRRRTLSGRHQALCLRASAATLAPARSSNADLLRTLDQATADAAEVASGNRAAVLAIGLGRSAIDGHPVEKLDLTTNGQSQIFQELNRVGLVPHPNAPRTTLRFVAPSDGVSSPIAAAGVDAFADALCRQMQPIACSSGPTIAGGK